MVLNALLDKILPRLSALEESEGISHRWYIRFDPTSPASSEVWHGFADLPAQSPAAALSAARQAIRHRNPSSRGHSATNPRCLRARTGDPIRLRTRVA